MSSPVVFSNAYLWINGVDLSGSVREVSLNRSSAMLDATVMGDAANRNKGGLKDWKVDMTFRQDFTCVDATLTALVGTTACFELRPINACAAVSNPTFTGIGTVDTYTPVGGRVGQLLEPKYSLVPYGADITRGTTCS